MGNCTDKRNGNFVIAIGRSFGAGGREVGHELSRRLGINYYDKELLGHAAERAGLNKALFEKNDERAPGFLSGLQPLNMSYNIMSWYGGGSAAFGGERIYQAQSDFIRELAERESCVIVGRTADYVLRNHPGLVSVFLHAPEDVCLERIKGRGDCRTDEEARQTLRRTNKLRAEFYNFYTGREWGRSSTYDLTLDSSKLTIDQICSLISSYLSARGYDPTRP